MKLNQKKRVLFLCTGNYYRSRFAEILFNDEAEKRGTPWTASSRGLTLSNSNTGPIAKSCAQELDSLGIHSAAAARLPLAVTRDDLEQADLIVAVKKTEHLPLLQKQFPAWTEKVAFWNVDDADGALKHVAREVTELLARLNGKERRRED